MIAMRFKKQFQKTVAVDNEPYGGIRRNEQAAHCRGWGQFTSSGSQRDADWFCTKMQGTDYVANLHEAQWDALSEARKTPGPAGNLVPVIALLANIGSVSTMQEWGTPRVACHN